MPFTAVGQSWNPATLRSHLATLARPTWCQAVTLHHTANPSLAQRPIGLQLPHLRQMQDHYQTELGWRSGPHLFADDWKLWGMTDFRERGVHAATFNARAIGIEVLGNYDEENPLIGRGLRCWVHAAAATRAILDWLGLPPSEKTVLFHRDDPRTRKSCPGRRVEKAWVLALVRRLGANQEVALAPSAGMSETPVLAAQSPRSTAPNPAHLRPANGRISPPFRFPRATARAPRWTL